MTTRTTYVCMTCGDRLTGWGNNPDPIAWGEVHPEVQDRRVCDLCNNMYVIPVRLGQDVEGPLFDTDGEQIGSFSTRPPEDR